MSYLPGVIKRLLKGFALLKVLPIYHMTPRVGVK